MDVANASLYREWAISNGKLRYQNEYNEGLTLLRGYIDAGEAGKESSWRLGDTAEVQVRYACWRPCYCPVFPSQYLLRVTVTPPKHIQGHIPDFKHEEIVDLTTDHWGALDRELNSTGGVPTPALGMVSRMSVLPIPMLNISLKQMTSSGTDDESGQWGFPMAM